MLRIRHGEEIAVGIVGKPREALPGIGDGGHAVETVIPELGDEPTRIGEAEQPTDDIVGPLRLVPQRIRRREEIAMDIVGKGRRWFGGDGTLD